MRMLHWTKKTTAYSIFQIIVTLLINEVQNLQVVEDKKYYVLGIAKRIVGNLMR